MTTPEINLCPVFLTWVKELTLIPHGDYYDNKYRRQQPVACQPGARIEAVRMRPQLRASSLHLLGGGWVAVWEQSTDEELLGMVRIKGFRAFCAATPCQEELTRGLVVRDYGDPLYPICDRGHERYIRECLLNPLKKFEITTDGRVVFGNLRG